MKQTELQAIILAGGAGMRLYPLVSDHVPKATLPIANRPMIHYTLSYLEKNGFKEAIVVALSSQTREIAQALKEYKGKISTQLKTIDSKESKDSIDSAQALREVHDLIYTDFLVMSVDLITDVPLLTVVDIHRQHNSSLTLLLKDESNISSSDDSDELDYFALTNYERADVLQLEDQPISNMEKRKQSSKKPTRVIMDQIIDSEEEKLSLPRSFLRNWSNFTLTRRLKDSHMYLFSKWVADLLVKKPEMYSIKHDLIPFLVDSQRIPNEKLDAVLHEVVPSFLQTDAYSMSTSETHPTDLIRVFAHVVPPHGDKQPTATNIKNQKQGVFCKRCLTLSSYLYINREVSFCVTIY